MQEIKLTLSEDDARLLFYVLQGVAEEAELKLKNDPKTYAPTAKEAKQQIKELRHIADKIGQGFVTNRIGANPWGVR